MQNLLLLLLFVVFFCCLQNVESTIGLLIFCVKLTGIEIDWDWPLPMAGFIDEGIALCTSLCKGIALSCHWTITLHLWIPLLFRWILNSITCPVGLAVTYGWAYEFAHNLYTKNDSNYRLAKVSLFGNWGLDMLPHSVAVIRSNYVICDIPLLHSFPLPLFGDMEFETHQCLTRLQNKCGKAHQRKIVISFIYEYPQHVLKFKSVEKSIGIL